MELNDLTQTSGEWLRGTGPEADIVISSRIRLARNLAEFPFISRATPQDRTQIERLMRDCMLSINTSGDLLYVAVDELEGVDRQLLVERHLISREHAESQGARAVAIDRTEKFSLMVNEEDHLRMQVMHSGLNLQSVWEQINRIDSLIEEKVTYAFHEQLGYLTACPTNVGTGMRRERDAAPARPWSSRGRSRRSSAACKRSAWRSAASTARARRRWAISTRSATRSRWAAAKRN